MKEKILTIMRSVFEDDTISIDCAQSNCEKWDSLKHLVLISELEEEYNVEFEPEEINEMKDFTKIYSILSKK